MDESDALQSCGDCRLRIGLKGASEARLRLGLFGPGGCNREANQGTLQPGRWELDKRLVSKARWTKSDESQMPCGRVAIGLKGASVQRSAAAFVGHGRQTRGRCDLDARTRAFTYDN